MMDPEDEQRKRLLIYFKDCVEYKFLQSFFEDLNVDEDHENRAKDELDVEKIQNEEEVNMFEFDQHQDYEWDDTGHLYWYFLDDDNPCVSDYELMSHHTLEMQTNEATGKCLGSHDGATETVNVTESELSTTEVTVEPDPVLAVPLRDSLPDDMDSDNMELSQLQMQLPLTKLYYSLDPASGTASDLVQVSVRKCLSASALLGTEMYVSTYPFVMAAAAPTVAIFLLVYCEASTTGMLLYEPDPLWLDLVALAYTLDHCTAALKLLLDGPKLVLSSIKVTDVAKAHLALLVVNNYNKIFSTYSYNRYHKFNVKSLVSASLAMLLMLYVANVMYGHTLFMSQHMLLTHLFAMAASVGVFLLVYNKLIFTTSGEYLKLLASACFTLQTALSAAIMVSFTVLLLPLFRLDTGTVLKVDRDYLLLHEKTAAKLHAFPSYKSCMFQNYYDLSIALMYATDTIIATYHVDWGARNFYLENLVVLASLYLFNEDYADVTVPLPLQDSCLLPSSDIVSEAKSPFVLVEVEPDSCQLLLGFHASAPLTNCLYFVDEVDLTQAHHGYPAFYCTTECIAASHTSCAQILQVLGSDPYYFANRDLADLLKLLASYVNVTLSQLCEDLTLLLLITALYAALKHDLLLHERQFSQASGLFVAYFVERNLECSAALKLFFLKQLYSFMDLTQVDLMLLDPGYYALVPLTNPLYSVDEVDLTQVDLMLLDPVYYAFVLLFNALYVADCSEIAELVQLSSKLTSPPLLYGLDMDQGYECEANLSTIGNQDHVDVTLLASLRYRGH